MWLNYDVVDCYVVGMAKTYICEVLANQVPNIDKTSFEPIYAQASFFKEATYNMDLMRYDTLFFYYALTRIERRTMSQPRATYIKLLLMALFV